MELNASYFCFVCLIKMFYYLFPVLFLIILSPFTVATEEHKTSPSPSIPQKEATSTIRSSRRRAPATPKKIQLRKRLDFVTKSKVDMKKQYKVKVAKLKSTINFAKVNQIKYLSQDIRRKKNMLTKRNATITMLKSQLANTLVGEELNRMKKCAKNVKRSKRLLKKRVSKALDKSESEIVVQVLDFEEKLAEKDGRIKELEDENCTLKESVSNEPSTSVFQTEGRDYPTTVRMFCYDCLVNNVPTNSVPTLLKQFGKRAGVAIDPVPVRNTVENMCRELGVISDVMSAEVLLAEDNLTIAFDATTQEGLHVNSVHITTKDKAYVLAVDQLPGGTAEDYSNHVNQAINTVTDTYCKLYNHVDFNETRNKIICNISNSMTDRAAVNHATIRQLELDWGKNINELNCHLHPLETIASSVRSVLKHCEPEDLSKKLFGSECISHQVILNMNKVRFKDGKGDPKGFINALETHNLPKGFLPRYRGNRLHIMFDIACKLHEFDSFFNAFLTESPVTCGGLQTALCHDYMEPVTKVELQVLGLLGKLLTGPWMTKFYTSTTSQISHIDGIGAIKEVITVLHDMAADPMSTLETTTDFFGNVLAKSPTIQSLQSAPVDEALFQRMMTASALKIIDVLQRQYERYFNVDITDVLRAETESARCHNIDAETIMGMFSASKAHAPNATMSFISSSIKARKNKVVDFLDDLEKEKREQVISMAVTYGRKQTIRKREKENQRYTS